MWDCEKKNQVSERCYKVTLNKLFVEGRVFIVCKMITIFVPACQTTLNQYNLFLHCNSEAQV